MNDVRYKIGTVTKLTGLSPFLLRAWENRYGLLEPQRSETGRRFYTQEDVETLLAVKRLLDRGHAIGEVAAWGPARIRAEAEDTGVVEPPSPPVPNAAVVPVRDDARERVFATLKARLVAAADALDRREFDSALAEAASVASFDTVTAGLLLPVLEIGNRWERGETSVAAEHFATSAIRQRLLSMIQSTSPTVGPGALVACAPGDYHEIGALHATYRLSREGWVVIYLGANLPVEELVSAIERTNPKLVGLAVTLDPGEATLRGWLEQIAGACPEGTRLLCGGPGAMRHADMVRSTGFEIEDRFRVADRRNRRRSS